MSRLSHLWARRWYFAFLFLRPDTLFAEMEEEIAALQAKRKREEGRIAGFGSQYEGDFDRDVYGSGDFVSSIPANDEEEDTETEFLRSQV